MFSVVSLYIGRCAEYELSREKDEEEDGGAAKYSTVSWCNIIIITIIIMHKFPERKKVSSINFLVHSKKKCISVVLHVCKFMLVV